MRELPALLLAAWAAAATVLAPDAGAEARSAVPDTTSSRPVREYGTAAIDWSGLARTGEASFYADEFAGRTMADGTAMDPQGDNAASRTLPLGTTARVTNLKTGQQAVVTIQDRGPYVQGRIVDLSPSTARKVGITKDMGVARVEVAPIAMPKTGEGRKAASTRPGAATGAAKDPDSAPASSH
jgi:rare lipoprotein A